ncbi:MAG: DUF302 domain-containing protein [Myxococcota bacterium]
MPVPPRSLPFLALVLVACAPALAPSRAEVPGDGLVRVSSTRTFEATVAALEAGIEARPLRLLATVPHSAAAAAAGLTLRPTTLVIFGRPEAGTPLMQGAPTLGLDLPQRMLVVAERDGVWVVYNDPHWLAARHGLTGADAALERIAGALAGLANEAAGR